MSQQGGSPEWVPPPAGRGEAGSRHYLTHPPTTRGCLALFRKCSHPPPTPSVCYTASCSPAARQPRLRELWPGPRTASLGERPGARPDACLHGGYPTCPQGNIRASPWPGLGTCPQRRHGSRAPLAPGKTQRPRQHLDSTVPARPTARPGGGAAGQRGYTWVGTDPFSGPCTLIRVLNPEFQERCKLGREPPHGRVTEGASSPTYTVAFQMAATAGDHHTWDLQFFSMQT